MKTAFLCPGQGRDINETQLEIVERGISSFDQKLQNGLRPSMIVGFSLGEITALACAEVISRDEAIEFVKSREGYIDEARVKWTHCPEKMAAIIGLSVHIVEELCEESIAGVNIGCYLNDDHVVVSGYGDRVDNVIALAEEEGAVIRVLPVKAAFHSDTDTMLEANNQLWPLIEIMDFSSPKIPFYSTVSGELVSEPVVAKTLLLRQMISPVLWEKAIRQMAQDGATEFTELEPAGTLTRLVKRILNH